MHGTDFVLSLDKDNMLDMIYMQMSLMKENLAKYPEVLVMDTTYKINNKNMHGTTLMSVDGNGNGQVVAHALISNESKAMITKFLSIFVENNPLEVAKTELVLEDKDFTEIGAIEETMPNVSIHLCMWHVLCAMRHRVNQEKLDAECQEKIREVLQQIAYAHSSKEYDSGKEALQHETADCSKLFQYFMTNWHSCWEKWVVYQRKDVPSYGNMTTNFLESFHSKLKKNLSCNSTLASCLLHLFWHNQFKNMQLASHALQRIMTQWYDLNEDTPLTKQVYSIAIDYAANCMIKQVTEAKKISSSAAYEKLQGGTEGNFSVTVGENTFTVYLAEEFSCTCSFYRNMHMICSHGFLCIMKEDLDLKEEWISSRWQQKHHIAHVKHQHVKVSAKKEKGPSSSPNDKYLAVLHLLHEIAGLCSYQSNAEFKYTFEQLMLLHNALITRRTMQISVIPDDHDTTQDIVTGSEGVQEEETMQEKNATGVTEEAGVVKATTMEPTQEKNATGVPEKEGVVSAARKGPTQKNATGSPLIMANKFLAENVVIIDHDQKPIGGQAKLKLKKTLAKNSPQRKTAMDMKRQKNTKAQSKKRKIEGTSTPAFVDVTTTPIYAFISRCDKQQLQDLFLYAKNTPDFVLRPKNQSHLAELKEQNTVTSLEVEVSRNGHVDDREIAVQSLLYTLKNELKSQPDLHKQADILSIMAILATFAFTHGMSIREALPTFYNIPHMQSCTGTTWPNLGDEDTETRYRIANNTITMADIMILRNGDWLNDRASAFSFNFNWCALQHKYL